MPCINLLGNSGYVIEASRIIKRSLYAVVHSPQASWPNTSSRDVTQNKDRAQSL